VDKARDKIERSAGDISAVMKEEKIEKEMRQAEMHVQKVRLAHTPQRDQLPQLGRNRSRELVDGESGRERLPWALFTWV
jgi:hypothetical protein